MSEACLFFLYFLFLYFFIFIQLLSIYISVWYWEIFDDTSRLQHFHSHYRRGWWSSSACPFCQITDCAANELVSGRRQIFTHAESIPLTDHRKIYHMWLRRQPLYLCKIWCKSVRTIASTRLILRLLLAYYRPQLGVEACAGTFHKWRQLVETAMSSQGRATWWRWLLAWINQLKMNRRAKYLRQK